MQIPDRIGRPRGLPPERTRLSRLIAWRRHVAGELAAATANRDRLATELEQVEEAKERVRVAVKLDARGLLDMMRRSVSWRLSDLPATDRAELDGRIAASRHHTDVAVEAIHQLGDEIVNLQRTAEALDAEVGLALNAAVAEHARLTLGPAYVADIERLRATLTRLEAAARMTGHGRDGRTVGEAPAFPAFCRGHVTEVEPIAVAMPDLRDATEAWRRLADAWSKDANADPDKHLRFVPLRADPFADVPYEGQSRAERRVADERQSMTGAHA